jgi:tetratricopeptide (TPR) repeat protein
MKIKLFTFCLLLIFVCGLTGTASAQRKRGSAEGAAATLVKTEKEELEAALALPPAERIEKLKAFIAAHPRSALKTRALEFIVSARAALGDEKLHAGDEAGGLDQFRLAVAEAPPNMSDKLFTEVVAQIPSNLFLRGERAASLEVARAIEERAKDNPPRLLLLAAFYLGIEAADEATRVADLAIKLAPEMSAAYQARAAAHRIALRLDESAADYARALELDPKSDGARRSLAELRRATGKTEEALAFYRERVQADRADEFARTGLVVSLFELGKKEEAERELETALKEMPNNLALLVGAAYWFAAHNESARAIELAEKAVALEPRYTWAHIALARGLVAQKRPLEAERALLIARQYGRFPTLDYELATALAAAGLYGEAATTLASSFAVKDNQIETYLAGRTLARASSFTELLAPERRASIFQFTAADSESNARLLKSLLAFTSTLNPAGGREAIKEADVVTAAQAFIGSEENARAFRRLYVARSLLESKIAFDKVLELTEAATGEVDAALNTPGSSVAVMAEDLRDTRARANVYGGTFIVPDMPRATLANILRGSIEDLAGWALFNQDKPAAAVVRLKRAVSVLPENTPWWRNALWHLGAALDADGKRPDALEAYIKSYRSGEPDPTRRAVIEALYRRVNGSLDGLDAKIGVAPALASNAPAPTQSAATEEPKKTDDTKPADAPPPSEAASEPKAETPKSADTNTSPAPAAEASPKPVEANPEPTPTPTSMPTPEPTPTPTPTPAEVPLGPPAPADNDEPPAAPTPTPTPTAAAPSTEPAATGRHRPRRASESCSLNINESSLTIQNNGGSALVTITLDGQANADNVTASTSDWSALAVFPEPKSGADSNSRSFSVTSLNTKTGMFTITFKSPCGMKEITVTVK